VTKVFLDTDVILDFLLKRRPFDEDAARIFAESEYGRLQLHTSTISFLNTYYVCGRIVGEHNALELVRELRKLIVLLSVTSSMVDSALTSDPQDLEDAVQLSSATSYGMDVLVTRNVGDFPKRKKPIMDPPTFVRTFIENRPAGEDN